MKLSAENRELLVQALKHEATYWSEDEPSASLFPNREVAEAMLELAAYVASEADLSTDSFRLDKLEHYMRYDAGTYFEVQLPDPFDIRDWVD